MKTKKLVIIKNWDAVEDLFDEYIEGEPNVVRFKLDARGGKKHLKNAAGTKSMALISENDPVITAMRSHPLLDLLIVEDGLYGVLPHWRQKQDADGNYLTKVVTVTPDSYVKTTDNWTEDLDGIWTNNPTHETITPDPYQATVPDMEWHDPDPDEVYRSIYKEIYPYHVAKQDAEGNDYCLPVTFTCSDPKDAKLFDSNTEWL